MKIINKKLNKLTYITYQVFPNEKANTIQTIRMLDSINTFDIKTKLIFPDRKGSNQELGDIKKFYQVEQEFEILKLPHRLPFNRIHMKKFEKFNFLISSFVWSYKTIKSYKKLITDEELVMTRTHWILYFASAFENIVVYECHKFSKIDNFIFKKLSKKNNVVVIFPNEALRDAFKISNTLLKNSMILESAYDEKMFFEKNIKKTKNKILFVGNLLRFNQSRNIEFLINAFHDDRLRNFKLTIVGGPEKVVYDLKHSLASNTVMLGRRPQKEAIDEILSSEIGVLINEDKDTHSLNHTSPIKYFEYLKGGLKVLAVDFPAHRKLPMLQNNFYFKKNDTEDFIEKLLIAANAEFIYDPNVKNYSYSARSKKLLNHVARLEGLEPPTL